MIGLVPNPSRSQECKINIHSTALALIFMNPFICTANPEDASTVVNKIESLNEFNEYERILEESLLSNQNVLVDENTELQNALKNVVVSYINSLAADSSKSLSKTTKINDDAIIISPVNIVSGHQVNYLGEDNFTISNWYGRWAKCVVPNDTLYLPPNNDFIDLFIGAPWVASQREFNLEIVPNEPPKEIVVYGLGMSNEDGTSWNELTEIEKAHVEFAGQLTVLIEFLPRTLSLITNFPFTFGSKEVAALTVGSMIRYQIQYAKNFEKAKVLLANNDYFGFYYMQIKEYLTLFITDQNFQLLVLKAAGITLTEAAFKSIAKVILLPMNVLFIGDDLTGIAKSLLGLYQSSLKTTFKVYSEEFKFGNVNGNVIDKESNLPIQGVRVQLLGDEGNPMNPNYIYVTDAQGGFWFENIMDGKKSLQVSKDEYGGKTVEIDVKDKETTEVTIFLSKEKGTLAGRVVNEIFIKNGITPINFNKECYLYITEIDGNSPSYAGWIYESHNGVFSKELTPGTYEIKVSHDDYKDAIATVTITGNETTQMEDLIMKPDSKMEGTIYYDINFDNSYEYHYDFEAVEIGGTNGDMGDCPDNSTRYFLPIVGFNDTEIIQIMIDTSQIKDSSYFNLGGFENCGCNGKTSIIALTKRFKCTHEEYGYQQDMVFAYAGDPNNLPCDCGITKPGNLVLTKYGNKLGDVIEGKINSTLAGWNNCHCSCCDDDGNHTVDCAKMQIDISFKMIVGSILESDGSRANELFMDMIIN